MSPAQRNCLAMTLWSVEKTYLPDEGSWARDGCAVPWLSLPASQSQPQWASLSFVVEEPRWSSSSACVGPARRNLRLREHGELALHLVVVGAAVLGAADLELARLLRLEPEAVDRAGHGVDLDAEVRQVEAWMTSVEATSRMTGHADRDVQVVQRDDVVLGVELAVGAGVARCPRPTGGALISTRRASGVLSTVLEVLEHVRRGRVVELKNRLPSTTTKTMAAIAEAAPSCCACCRRDRRRPCASCRGGSRRSASSPTMTANRMPMRMKVVPRSQSTRCPLVEASCGSP